MADSRTNNDSASQANFDNVVSAAYAAAAGVRPWGNVCGELCTLMDLWCVQIMGVFPGTRSLAFAFEGGQVAPEAALQYVTRYHAINPRFGLNSLLRKGSWVHDHEHLDEAFVAQSPFYQDYLIPFGGRFASATVLLDEPELFVLLTLHRGVGKLPLGAMELEQVDRICRHLESALQIHLRRQSVRQLSVAGHALIEVLPQAVLIVDETRLIMHRNPAASEILALGGPLVDRGGYLDCTDRRGSRELVAALHSLGLGGALIAGSGADRALLRLPGTNGLADLIMFAIAVRPGTEMRTFGDEPCAILVVHRLDAATRLDPLIMSLAFDLTPAEAQVAVAIAEGSSPDEVAATRGVTVFTVRAQLRAIFDKLGVRRQPEMVRMLLALPRLWSVAAEVAALPQNELGGAPMDRIFLSNS